MTGEGCTSSKDDTRPRRYYVGLTADLRARLAAHNAGRGRIIEGRLVWARTLALSGAGNETA
jgi:predicted GIY-YIG superfamily endonuclease